MKKKLILAHPESPGMKVVVYRGLLKRLLYPSAFATLGETMKSAQIDITKAERFVEHIQRHLMDGDKVMCKICGKTIDEITSQSVHAPDTDMVRCAVCGDGMEAICKKCQNVLIGGCR